MEDSEVDTKQAVISEDVASASNVNKNKIPATHKDGKQYRKQSSCVIHNSNSVPLFDSSKATLECGQKGEVSGARPKDRQSRTLPSMRFKRRGSYDSALCRPRDRSQKRYHESTKLTNSSGNKGTHAHKSEDRIKRAEEKPCTDDLHQLEANKESENDTRKSSTNELENSTKGHKNKSANRKSNQSEGNRVVKKGKDQSAKPQMKERDICNKENRLPKKHQAKVTYLYVILVETVAHTSDIKPFLQHRMGNPKALDFDIVNTYDIKRGRSTINIVVLQFNSCNKASVARHLLHVSNKGVSSKINCFFEKEDAEGSAVDMTKENASKLERAFTEIVETAFNVSSRHETKINEVRTKLSDVDKALSRKRGVSLYEFEKLSNEKLAFQDKLEELGGQYKEFKKYVDQMNMKLKQLIHSDKLDKELNTIRKEFGVECRRLEDALPMYARREDILKIIMENQVCVILGETGSGKSTQMAQYIYQAGFAAEGLIACTQPRKIAAVSLATRVASELATGVGQEVGYKVGMQSKMSSITKVLFMTDHILLNECLHDEVLTKYSCILIDEAHERSIYTDLLLGMIKKALKCRPDLKVIITSATIDPDTFVNYFGGKHLCPVLKVSGRTFPVDVFWEDEKYFENSFPDDYETKALSKAIEIHQSEPIDEGDILVFLTSAFETERCTDRLKNRLGEANVLCLQLHGKLKAEEQQLVFKGTPAGKRKIVFATNSAETSITIPGIKFVVDTGVVKEMRFDPKKNMNSLDVVPISQSSADQRKGRAGRTAKGLCYRLYTMKDFKNMKKCSSPEILRIQVSQALLKLMELGVDPISFDYVQSPSFEAMTSSMRELKDLGAASDTGITDIGKWIAKLPVEPRLGLFVKRGIDMDISAEALVVASCCNQSGIFFRVGSQEEKEAADVKKIKFCHLGGDLLTMLNVYREWDKVQERAKGKWCQSNSINGKTMKNVREMTNEIIASLKKEMNMKVKHSFRDPEVADNLVQKLIFECMSTNLGYYLGHESVGYLVVNRHQRVQIHPSSSLKALGFQPVWVVFNKVLRTSADFMTEVTPVSSDTVDKAISDGKICLDLISLEAQKIHRSLEIPVGKHLYWRFVCSMQKLRKQTEEDIQAACDDTLIVVEANKQRGVVSLFSLPAYKDQASAMLLSRIESLRQQLLFESREDFIGSENSGIRAVLRLGGAAVDVLMPDEFRSLNIKQKECSRYDIAEEDIRELFESYGPVEQIWRPTGKKQYTNPFWGKVTFTHEIDAVAALDSVNDDDKSDITLIPVTFENQKPASRQGFTMKVTWDRRPSKGHCFVYLDRPEDMALLIGSSPKINGQTAMISLAKPQCNLFVKGLLPDVTEDQIKDGLARELGLLSNTSRDRFRVIIPRVNPSFRPGESLTKQEALARKISRYARHDSFRVKVLDYKEKTVCVIAFVTFSDPQECYETFQQMINDHLEMDGNKVNVSLECKSSVHINRRLYDAVVADIDSLIDRYTQRNSSTLLEVRHLKSGHFSLDIKAVSPQKLARTKVRVDRIVGGDVLECGEKENLHALFSTEGRNLVKNIEKTTRTMIFIDERQMKVTIQGLERGRILALNMIEDYISKQEKSAEIEVQLKGEENPPGLLKALLLKYGTRFEVLKEETNISGMKLNLRYHEITITGSEEAVRDALKRITVLKEEIVKRNKVMVLQKEMPDCPICLCPVEEADIYRLEYCGHAYCKVCVTSQVQSAVTDRKFPVICAAEDCKKPFVIRDINLQIKMGKVKKKELLDAAVACLVMRKNESFRFCITPNCEAVYRTSSDGSRFVCPVCQAKVCTSCHIDFHDGLTCAMYRSAKKDDRCVEKWIKERPQNRKMCPKCRLGIEKIDGCDHVTCSCGVHICWKCLEYFSSSGSCYGHLSKMHESFV